MASPRKPSSPRAKAGPGARPDPIAQARAAEGSAREAEALAYEHADTGVKVVALPASKALVVVDDPDLDAAILELKAKAPEAFTRFLARAIYKENLYVPPENADANTSLRRLGAWGVASNVHLLVADAERRMEERAKRDAKRRSNARKPAP